MEDIVNLTVEQENEAWELLRKLVKKSKGMLPGVELMLYERSIPSDGRSLSRKNTLILKKEGLFLESAWKVQCWRHPPCDEDHDSGVDKSKVRPSVAVIREYDLTVSALSGHLAQLQ